MSEYIAEISVSSGSDDNSDGEEAATDEPAVHSFGLSFRTSQGENAPFTPEYEALTMQRSSLSASILMKHPRSWTSC